MCNAGRTKDGWCFYAVMNGERPAHARSHVTCAGEGDKLVWAHYHKDHTPPAHGPAPGAGSALGQSCAPDLSQRQHKQAGKINAAPTNRCSVMYRREHDRQGGDKEGWLENWGAQLASIRVEPAHKCRAVPVSHVPSSGTSAFFKRVVRAVYAFRATGGVPDSGDTSSETASRRSVTPPAVCRRQQQA